MTDSLEEYLYAIYVLSNGKKGENREKEEKEKNEENEENIVDRINGVRVTDIANKMEVTKASTNNALNLLKEQGLINYEKYKNITLTKNGIARAKYIERRHELFRIFLKDIIKTDEHLVEEETEKLAHCISCHTAAKLEKFIENYMQKSTKGDGPFWLK